MELKRHALSIFDALLFFVFFISTKTFISSSRGFFLWGEGASVTESKPRRVGGGE